MRQALIEEMTHDERVVLLGEDIGVFGGSYRVTEGLWEMFGESRVRDTPISEIAIVGAAVGAAMTGLAAGGGDPIQRLPRLRHGPVVQSGGQAAIHDGRAGVGSHGRPCAYGATGRAAQHSQSLEAWFMHTPGLKVVMPSTPYDAKGLLKTAIRDGNPVIFLEHKLLYGSKSPGGKAKSAVGEMNEVFRPAPPEEYTVPFGVADVKRAGTDVTVVATGYMVHRAIRAAAELENEGVSVEVIDPRTLAPLDTATILASVEKTSRLVVVSEDVRTCGMTAEIAARVAEEGLYFLERADPPGLRARYAHPLSPAMEAAVIPQVDGIVDAIRSTLNP